MMTFKNRCIDRFGVVTPIVEQSKKNKKNYNFGVCKTCDNNSIQVDQCNTEHGVVLRRAPCITSRISSSDGIVQTSLTKAKLLKKKMKTLRAA